MNVSYTERQKRAGQEKEKEDQGTCRCNTSVFAR